MKKSVTGIVCSFVERTGSAVVNGKTWRWDFHPYLGPTFVDANGEPLKRIPSEKHPVWGAFSEWFRQYELQERASKKGCEL